MAKRRYEISETEGVIVRGTGNVLADLTPAMRAHRLAIAEEAAAASLLADLATS
jgi:NAD(P)H-hydrate repair Nnr-like enzyme with NAD(P)H-hydrate dehydratase domain